MSLYHKRVCIGDAEHHKKKPMGRLSESALRWLLFFIRHLIGHPIRHPSVIFSEKSLICVMKMACMVSSFMTVNSAISVALSDISSDISSDILYEKPTACAKIGLLLENESVTEA